MSENNYFKVLNAIDCSDKIEKKNGLSYLSWAYAWAEAKKFDPSANYTSALKAVTEEKMQELSLKGIPSLLFEKAKNAGGVSARTAFDATKAGDKHAKRIVDDYIFYLAEGVTNMINIFPPEVLSIGGGVCNQGEYLTKPLIEIVERDQYTRSNKNKTKILTAALGNDAGIIGAAGLGKKI